MAGKPTQRNERVELTFRALLLGAAITLLFTAANVYLGLKVGLTFASTIPAAVISMAVLRAFKNSSIFENNIVQTVASAAGTLSAIVFVLPGLVMIGWWHQFPFWETFSVCIVGGTLGVMYSVPLRRALVAQSDLPYPEGVAAAEVLKVGTRAADPTAVEHNRAGLRALVVSSLVSAGYAILAATRTVASALAGYVRIGAGATGFGFNLSFALMGAGHLVGLAVGLAFFAGIVIAWGVATPVLSAMHPMAGPAVDVALAVWAQKVRFLGAGAIATAALWTLGKLAAPVYKGLVSAIAASRRRAAEDGESLPRAEQDIPIAIVAIVSCGCLVPLGLLLASFLSGSSLASSTVVLVVAGIAFVVIAGFLVAAASGYMAGLIGSSNSPISGLGILAAVSASVLLVAIVGRSSAAASGALVAFALFVTAVCVGVATISNDNLQDLKTGQLVDATPWRQQVSLVGGVLMGGLVIPPVLDLLNRAYGFVGGPAAQAAGAQPLPAPQATLIAALAKGVIEGKIDWSLIGIGALVGMLAIAVDELLRSTRKYHLPPLGVGLGIYLPPAITAPIVAGSILGWYYNRWAARQRNSANARQIGVLVASGLIVGESLFGVVYAGAIVASNRAAPLAVVGDSFATAASILGAIVFALAVWALYRWSMRLSAR